ncbi:MULTISPECIES: outer membrane protein assembly factor BamA [unclassified Methylophaga]|jgi:outer membrane protein insertion porin family|uniref:outer membrane protein assembly factor BamA n=3 Tax=Methylophaga TaxID=40222 RepID=UPI000C9700CE|nr:MULTISPECIES: outer membrane protein assembly factor BamA [unclassified Methylophaga]MAK67045.1 outer membrane protein assembly factor BamA [Methylophaga sp.]MAY18082.1 outer membrane protein assembly factor BamA [Methylophaga sp.]MBN45506.1 outer membrane protein assembly factor BamA [Methylophaga sp.]HCD03988.1 outer membrane protein assembly factor BamA [Methylophaga sp.]|tara:strand:- start:163097 stop:165373 length:2277 start_codon:yes stop_codon:yes gene_type:complete
MKQIITALTLILLSSAAWAEEFIIKDIRVEGLQRISAGTVFNFLPVKVGDELTENDVRGIIRSLFKSKYFNDVQVERDDGVLVIKVSERPAISSIEFVGNKDLDSAELTKSLRQIGFAEGQVFEQAMLERVELELQRQYFSRGKYGVAIDSEVTPLSRNRVAVRINMAEGVVATIGEINIVGNNSYDDEELLGEFESTTGGWLSSLTKDNQYSRQKLSADLESLRSFYLDRGYVDFTVESTQVTISDDKKQMFITINIAEGERYKINEVRLAGNLIVPEEELFNLVTIRKNSVFSRKAITSSSERLTDRLGNDGYAFANVNAVPDIDRETREVNLTFFVDPGRRAYVRRINISGNSKTRDEVLRQEMRQQESAWISTGAVERSRERISRLGYFEDVNVETLPVAGTSDQVDLDFNVTEMASGSLSAGIGYSQSDGIIFNANVTQKNFFGSGKHVRFGFNNSRVNTVYSFGYTNPFATVDGISQGFNLFYRETDAFEANIANYTTDVFGGDINFGIPISENNRINLAFGYENTQLDVPSNNEITRYDDFIEKEGDSFHAFPVTIGWSSDTRNNAILPTRGMSQSVSAEVATPIGDLQYYKLRYRNNWYTPLNDTFTFALRTDLGYGKAYGDSEQFPFFQNFYAGGIRSVRGFRANTLGVREADRPLGGNLMVTGGAEIIFPIPFMKKALRSFRLSTFVDVGNVYDVDQSFEADLLRYSTGLSAIWISPFGAMSFSIAAPLRDQPDDETEVFQFSLGSTF